MFHMKHDVMKHGVNIVKASNLCRNSILPNYTQNLGFMYS